MSNSSAQETTSEPVAAGPGDGNRMLMMQRLVLPVMLFSSGLCGIAYEILYGRLLGNIIGDQFLVSTAILLTFLLGIGLGARFAHRLWRLLWLIDRRPYRELDFDEWVETLRFEDGLPIRVRPV